MKFHLPKIYPITDVKISNLTHVAQVKILIKAGAKLIQLREKNLSSREFYYQAKEAADIARSAGVKIIINDRADLALTIKADGVHLGQEDLSPEHARKILGDKAIIGLSTHTVQQALDAVDSAVDYIAIGPVFPTTSKNNPDRLVGIEGVKQVRNAIGDFPLVAIGGINLDNFMSVYDSGADSIALISALFSQPEKINEIIRRFSTETKK